MIDGETWVGMTCPVFAGIVPIRPGDLLPSYTILLCLAKRLHRPYWYLVYYISWSAQNQKY